MQSRRPEDHRNRRSWSPRRSPPRSSLERSRRPPPFGFRDTLLLSPQKLSRYQFMDRSRDNDYLLPPPTRNKNELGGYYGSLRDNNDDVITSSKRFNRDKQPLVMEDDDDGLYYKSTVPPSSKPDHTSPSLNITKQRLHYPDVRDNYSFQHFTSIKHHYSQDVHNTKNNILSHPRDTTYHPDFRSKAASHFNDYATTSPRRSRLDYPPASPPRHIPEPLPHYKYEQKPHRDTDQLGMAPYREERFSPPRTGLVDSFRLQREKDSYLYPSDEIYEKMDLHDRVTRDVFKPNLLDRVTHRPETSDFAHRNMSSRGSLDRIPVTVTSNIGFSRPPADKRGGAQYLDDTVPIHSRLGRKVSREDEMRYMDMAQDLEMERARADYYDFKRDLSSGSRKERMGSLQGFLYEREHRMDSSELSPYDSSGRYLKRKHPMEDEESRIPSRSMMSRLDTVSRRHYQDSRDEEWIDQDVRRSNVSRRMHKVYDDDGDDEFIYDPDEFFHVHDHDHRMRSHKYDNDDEYAKGYSRSIGRVGYHPNRRNVVPRWKNVPENESNDKDADMYSDEIEPHEDTKDFKQLVNDYFLSFTKKLNENPVVRRRYMEQGREGSLFCVVCGRSLSKEFLDTQRLAMHAFMSRKAGLRAPHLGLLKAICVMLGWNSVIPTDTPRWFPETLSTTEAWAQKQDLIIWPPLVIVHNISILNNSSNGEGPTTVEALGQFLRGLGLSGGKVKLGKPSNCSVMLVKFLGTFSGLQDAEKIHEYFSKKKRGRKHLEQITSGKGKSSRDESADKGEAERVLFGYMGIAEDLDKVDIDTKRKCSIKSKKEIQDIADAPVKPGE